MKLHLWNTDAQRPLCGQRERTGRTYLPKRCTTTDPQRVQCLSCLQAAERKQQATHMQSIVNAKG